MAVSTFKGRAGTVAASFLGVSPIFAPILGYSLSSCEADGAAVENGRVRRMKPIMTSHSRTPWQIRVAELGCARA